MTFDKDGICELESITSVDECEAYRYFLEGERRRHMSALQEASRKAAFHGQAAYPYFQDVARFFDSAALRHQQDLDAITKRLEEIEAHKAGLNHV